MNDKKCVVITGCSSGIGRSLCKEFLAKGFVVVGVSRTKPDFDITKWIQADITKKDDLNLIFETISKSCDRIDVFINNAGVGIYEEWEKTDISDLRALFDVNFFAPVELSRLAIPFLKKSSGTLINTSSVAGLLYVPVMGGYCASKFALNAFSDSLRVELKKHKIQVISLIVGRINTGFSSRAFGSLNPPETPGAGSPDKLAEKVFKAYRKRKKSITFPWWYDFVVPFAKIFSCIYDAINIKVWKIGGGK